MNFTIASNPHWSNLLTLYPLSDISAFEFIGHFILFFILTALLIDVLSIPRAVMLAMFYGIFTELIQPFFSRGAEGVDLLANVVGILTYAGLYGMRKVGLAYYRRVTS